MSHQIFGRSDPCSNSQFDPGTRGHRLVKPPGFHGRGTRTALSVPQQQFAAADFGGQLQPWPKIGNLAPSAGETLLAPSRLSILKVPVPWQDGSRMTHMQNQPSLDVEEVARFDQISAHWWDPQGEFRPLHAMNPVRIGYIRDQIVSNYTEGKSQAADQGVGANPIKPLEGLRLADIGCGGGLLSEPLARLGARVTGIDASQRAIDVAKEHASRQSLAVDYRCCTAEDLAENLSGEFDVVTCLEIVEHVADVPAFVAAVAGLLKPGGLIVFSTLNRTAKSFAVAIAGAEYLLRLLPRGTHDWRRFLTPDELERFAAEAELEVKNVSGMIYSPSRRTWTLSERRLAVNYLLTAVKKV